MNKPQRSNPNSNNEKKPKKKKDGLLNIKGNTPVTLPEYIKEMHPPKKVTVVKITDDGVIRERVIEINTTYVTSVEKFIETGRLLNKLDKEIEHGKWLPLFKGYQGDEPTPEVQFRFGKRKAQMLMAIAADPFCGNAQNSALLPTSWTGLHEAVQKISDELPDLFASNEINNESTHEEIKKLIARVKPDTCNFTSLFNHVVGLIAYMKDWPAPVEAMSKVFFRPPGFTPKLETDDITMLSEWLRQLDGVIYEYDPDDESGDEEEVDDNRTQY